MSLLTANVFASLVVSLIRRGTAWRESRIMETARNQPLGLILPVVKPSLSSDDPAFADKFELEARMWAAGKITGLVSSEPDHRYAGILKLTNDGLLQSGDNGPLLHEGQESQFAAAVEALLAEYSKQDTAQVRATLISFELTRIAGDQSRDRWSRFGRFIVGVSLDVIAEQPQLIGGGRSTQSLVSALLPNVAARYGAEQDGPSGRLAQAFYRGGLETLINRPDLASREPRWQALVTGILEPIQDELAAREAAGHAGELRAQRTLSELFEGPIAARTLEMLSASSDAFFKGEVGRERAAGLALRHTLGALASEVGGERTVREVFKADAWETVVRSTLSAAAERPDLFLNSRFETDRSKLLVSEMANVLSKSPKPFQPDSGVAADIAAITIDAVSVHLAQRLAARADANPQARLGANLATHLAGIVLDGFRSAVRGDAPVLDARFSRTQSVAILKLVADHIAQSPDAFFGAESETRAKGVAKAVVEAIAADSTGLLTAENWRLLIGQALMAALGNPGTLFESGPKGCVVVLLSAVMLEEARANMASPANLPGRVLFGDTLQQALLAAFDAASTGMLNIVAIRGNIDTHLDALRQFIRALNELAASDNPQRIISNREWLVLFRHYVAHVLARGLAEADSLTPEVLFGQLARLTNPNAGGEA